MKLPLSTLLLGAALFVATGTTTLSADMKCGAGKCGAAMMKGQGKMDGTGKGSGKCGQGKGKGEMNGKGKGTGKCGQGKGNGKMDGTGKGVGKCGMNKKYN